MGLEVAPALWFFRFLELKYTHLEVVEGHVVYQAVGPNFRMEMGHTPLWSFGIIVIKVRFSSAQELWGSKWAWRPLWHADGRVLW